MKNFRLFLYIFAIGALIGCGSSEIADEATATVDPVLAMQAALQSTIEADLGEQEGGIEVWREALTDARQTWANANVDDYTITVTYTPNTNNTQTIYTIEVRDNEIVSQSDSCIFFGTDTHCIVEKIDFETVTVPGLHNLIEAKLESREINANGIEPDFDETYGYPIFISLPAQGQIAHFWRVDSFEPLND